MKRNLAVPIVILAGAVVAAVLVANDGRAPTDDGRPDGPVAVSPVASLTTFGACDDLTDWLGRNVEPYVTPWGLQNGWGGGEMWFGGDGGMTAGGTTGGDMAAGEAQRANAPASAADSATSGGATFSNTNVQEEGVDEPDVVKTDGRRLYTIREGRLLVVDVTGDAPRVIGSAALPPSDQGGAPFAADLFLAGDRVLAIWTDWRQTDLPAPAVRGGDAAFSSFAAGVGVTRVALFDVSAAGPVLLQVADLDGNFVTARRHGDVVRLVVKNQPMLPWVQSVDGTEAGQRAALDRNRQIARTATAGQWLPWVRVTTQTAAGGVTAERPMVRCEDVHHPGGFAGVGSLDVVTLPMGGSLDDLHATSVLTGADTVYASADRLYVTSYTWPTPVAFDDVVSGSAVSTATSGGDLAIGAIGAPAPQPIVDFRTALHAFDLGDPTRTSYLGSGEVEGTVLNQFSLSEHEGYLRVATTVGAPWQGGSESGVHVFALEDGRLREVGSIGDLGRGERIYAVRYVGDVGYVVTFRQVDPLYTIDLSDPEAPRLMGELKIPGYSAYLHPVSDTLLLGIGQDASLEGRTQGTQVSLFDVSDLTAPRRVASSTLEGANSDAEFDHHAFLYWPQTGLTVVPVQVWSGQVPWSGAMAFTVGSEGTLDRAGSITHTDEVAVQQAGPDGAWWAADQGRITRSLVLGDRLLTLSNAGLMTSTLDTLEKRDWLSLIDVS